MNTKDKLLSILEENKGSFLSGEELARRLSISRTSVWKAIKNLQKSGYNISAVTNRGYSLATDTDILSISSIKKYLNEKYNNIEVSVLEEATSTNNILKEEASRGGRDLHLLAASHQTLGKGRRGRSFYSPKDTGVYFSLLLKPMYMSLEEVSSITTMAAVSVCIAIEKVFSLKPQIKWVNDIYLNDKKICGILTEASYDMESGYTDYAVLGIGINLYPPKGDFPQDIKDTATYITNQRITDGKSRIISETINSFMDFYTSGNKAEYTRLYKEKSLVLGRDITVIFPDKNLPARALDIDENCHLIVEYPEGERDILSSGEISIRFS